MSDELPQGWTMASQRRIVRRVTNLFWLAVQLKARLSATRQVEALKRLHVETAADLDAFKGEL
jgi:hypothetical protein